jgi:hypothetical protein
MQKIGINWKITAIQYQKKHDSQLIKAASILKQINWGFHAFPLHEDKHAKTT